MQIFASGVSNAVYNIVTGDESWFYCYDPETKRLSAQWVFPFEELPTKVNLELAPSDFYTFLNIKEKLLGKWFTNTEEVVAPYEKVIIKATPKYEWAKCFSQWFHPTQRYIVRNGFYFEQQ
ncbi:hypothetical protein EVAR_8982_1 [Eumeta japonica]|uniref:Uncharacterized protein n=1 Tax=Eumeta variegata TaxID=151549 RepID=A0A4C1WSV2_EUMVA|nr:hypothetical protein EVAR_8982_1 [Eumeta japonica]